MRGAGAFDNPEALKGYIEFLRETGTKLNASAVLSLVPTPAVSIPRVRTGGACLALHMRHVTSTPPLLRSQTWERPNWPCGTHGVFAQLESSVARKLWFVPVEQGTKKPQPPVSLDYESFALLPRLLRGWGG